MNSCKGHVEAKERGFYICSMCECSLGVHVFYFHCPLLENEIICSECCFERVASEGALKTFKEIGKEYTREQIEKICGACGNRSCGARVEEQK